jgi:hypothetical protein
MAALALLVAVYVVGSAVFTCALLTGVGAHRRGHSTVPVLLSAMFFPVAWTLWHLQDSRPLRMAGRTTA